MFPVSTDERSPSLGVRLRHLLPASVRRAGAQVVASRRAAEVERYLARLATDPRPILVGPWLGEVGFELLYWIPFLRWFVEKHGIAPGRLIALSRGGAAAAWYRSFAGATYDALAFMSQEEFRRKNTTRSERLGEQKQIAPTALEAELLAVVRRRHAADYVTLHPSTMYRLFAPYWWGHQPIEWVRAYTRFAPLAAPGAEIDLPADYTAVKFYFNDCFQDTPENRDFVERTIAELSAEGPVISLSTGVSLDDHAPCEPDVAAMRGIGDLLTPQNNLIVQSAIVARARRFVGTYGGFAYLAPLYGVPATSFFSEPGTFSVRHLNLMLDVTRSAGRPQLLQVLQTGSVNRS